MAQHMLLVFGKVDVPVAMWTQLTSLDTDQLLFLNEQTKNHLQSVS
jgi:hypothetical protein